MQEYCPQIVASSKGISIVLVEWNTQMLTRAVINIEIKMLKYFHIKYLCFKIHDANTLNTIGR